jgi:hypothetical protein
LISRKARETGCHDNGGNANLPTGPSQAMIAAANTVLPATEPYRVFDARSISRRMRHEIVYEALEQLPPGATFR